MSLRASQPCAAGRRNDERNARGVVSSSSESRFEERRRRRLPARRASRQTKLNVRGIYAWTGFDLFDAAGGQPLRDQEGGSSSDWLRFKRWSHRVSYLLYEVCLDQVVSATDALSDVIAGEFDVHPTRPGAEPLVNVKEAAGLGHHVGECPSLVSVASLEGVAVHRVANPGHLPATSAVTLATMSGNTSALSPHPCG